MEYPEGEGNDQAGFFSQRNKVGRINKPALRMLPANQRFEAREVSVLERNYRLIVNAELFLTACRFAICCTSTETTCAVWLMSPLLKAWRLK